MKTRFVIGLSIAATLAASSAFANNLLFSVDHKALGADGSAIETWGSFTTLAGGVNVTAVNGTNWADNTAGSGKVMQLADYTAPIAIDGSTIVTRIKAKVTQPDGGWDPRQIVNVMYNQFGIGVERDGSINIFRDGDLYWSRLSNPAFRLTDGQEVTLAVTVQNDGAYEVWADGVSVMSGAAKGAGTFTSWDPNRIVKTGGDTFVPGHEGDYSKDPETGEFLYFLGWDPNKMGNPGFDGAIDLGGRYIDGWMGSNALIGDTYLFANALSTADRLALESTIAANYGVGAPVPEPASMLAMFSGLVGLAGFGIRRRK